VAEEHRSFCRICSAACGIVVTTEGQQVVKVRGDADHPLSRGYTCSKGRGLPAWHHAPGRLDRPRLDGRDAPWDVVLDDLAARLDSVRSDHGADAISLYLATGLAYDAAGQAASVRWLYGTGSTTFYSAATVDNAPVLVAADLVAGNSGLNPVWEPGSGGPLLVVGCNPVVSHGYGTTLPDPVRHLRDHQRSGGRIWVVDPRRTETAALADHHLRARPGSDVELLAFLAHGLLGEGRDSGEVSERCRPDEIDALRTALAPFDRGRAITATGLDGEELDDLLAAVRGCDRRLAVFCGTGTTMARDGVLVEWLRWVLLVLTGSLDRPGGMRFNRSPASRMRPWKGDPTPLPGPASRPDLPRVAGQVPAAAMVDEIEAGHLRALVITGGNPLAAFPEPDRVRAALASLDVLAVLDVAESDVTALATHVLPATGQLERADVKLNEAPSLRVALPATSAVVAPVADRRPSWWIMAQLGARLGVDLLDGADPDELTDESYLGSLLARSPIDPDEVFAAGPHGREIEPEYGWVRETMLPEGRWRIAPRELLERLDLRCRAGAVDGAVVQDGDGQLLLVPRREMAWSNSVRYAGEGVEPVLRLHPDDAARLVLDDGGRSTVASAHGEVVAVLAVDAGVRPGTASLTHGRTSSPAGVLTSATVDVDPLTTMPLASGLPVTVTRA
jgi:anaerobic selenocysteine-containing dehydrogenase